MGKTIGIALQFQGKLVLGPVEREQAARVVSPSHCVANRAAELEAPAVMKTNTAEPEAHRAGAAAGPPT